jgi:aminocarboxymuconate-semialdehyde decarboxylase
VSVSEQADRPLAAGIDTHAHYYPKKYLDLLAEEGCACGACVRADPRGPVIDVGPLHAGPLAARFIDLDLRIADMDTQGVAVQALSLTQPMVYFAPPALARRLSAAFNDALVEAHERFPSRLYGLAMLPMHDAGEALAELERVSAAPGIRGVYMGTTIGDMALDDGRLLPVFEAIEDARLPVFLHPLEVIGMRDRLKKYFLANLLGNPFDTAVAAAHLMFGGVLSRFPRLQVVLPHGGGALPYLIGRLKHGAERRPELAHVEGDVTRYLRRFHYDTITHSEAALRYLIDLVGADRLLLGSDYCFDMGDERPVETVTKAGSLTVEQRNAIISENAGALLGLHLEQGHAPMGAPG